MTDRGCSETNLAPVPVKHEPGSVATEVFQGMSKAFSPDVSVLSTITLPASTTTPVLVLPRDNLRFRATIRNTGTSGVAIIGPRESVNNGVGGQLPVGADLKFYSGKEYYAVAQGATAAQLTVLIESFSQGVPEAV
jgi:hypothetical protein